MALSKITSDFETKESDEIREMFCEHCDKEGKYTEAEGFCVDCNDFMCAVCVKYHLKYKPEHTTQNKDDMPKDYCFEKCPIHSKLCIKFYCLDCEKFACSECVSKNDPHTHDCISKIWSPLYEVLHEIDINKTNMCMKTKVVKLTDAIKEMEDSILSTRKDWHKCNENVRVSIEVHRKEIERKTFELEHRFQKRVDEIEDTFNTSLDAVSKDVAALKLQANGANSCQKQAEQSQNSCSKFIAMKNVEHDIQPIEHKLRELKEKLIYKEHMFIAREHLLDDPRDFGHIVLKSSELRRTGAYKCDLNIDAYYLRIMHGNINDMCIHKDFLIVVVRVCKVIVLTEPSQNKVLHKVTLSSGPIRVTSISENRVAVTLPDEGKIQLFAISDSTSLHQLSALEVEAGCWGIAYSKDQDCLCVSYRKPKSKVSIMTTAGQVLKVLDKDLLENKILIDPENIAISQEGKTLYVSDSEREMLIKISLEGKVEAVYKNESLKGPRGIAVDENGSVYVCGRLSNNIHQLSSDLSVIATPVGSAELNQPISVALCTTSKCLFVGMMLNTNIKVFTLSQTL